MGKIDGALQKALGVFDDLSFPDINWEIVFSHSITYGVISSLIFGVCAACFTSYLFNRRQSRRFSGVRKRIHDDLVDLINKSLSGIENVSFYIDLKNRTVAASDVVFSTAHNLHTFCEWQIVRTNKFQEILYYLSEGLEPDERYKYVDLMSSWPAMDEQILRNISNSALKIMDLSKFGDFNLELSDVVEVRAVTQISVLIPSGKTIELIKGLCGTEETSRHIKDNEAMNKISLNFQLFLGVLSKYATSEMLQNEVRGYGWLANVDDLPQLSKCRAIVDEWRKYQKDNARAQEILKSNKHE